MDLGIQTVPAGAPEDHSWLAGDSSAFETAQSGTLDTSSLTSGTHYDATTKVVPSGLALTFDSASGKYKVFTGGSEAQLLTITGGPTGGTFTITFDGETTAAIAYNATPATVQAALEALSNVAPGDIVVGGSAGAWTLTFGGRYADQNVPQVTAASSLTGGTTPAITPSTTTAGVTQTLDGFLAQNEELLRPDGTLAPSPIIAVVKDAVLDTANLPVAAHRSIDASTPTTGKWAFVNH